MMKFLSFVFICASIGSTSAMACSYAIDQDAIGAELEKVAIAALQKSSVKTLVATVDYHESISTPMCPLEMTYQAKIVANYKDGLNRCTAQLKVTKIEPWGERAHTVPVSYSIEGLNTATCLK